MKICMISYSQFEFDNRVHRYARSLIRRGDQVDVICLGARKQPRVGVFDGARLYRVQTRDYNEKSPLSYLLRMMVFFVRSFVECTRLHLKNRYQVMHFHNIPDFGVFSMVIPRLMGAKVIMDIHDLVPEFYQRKFGLEADHPVIRLLCWMEKLSCRFSNHVITVTTLWQDTLSRRSVSREKCSVVLNAPDPQLFHRGYPMKDPDSRPFRLVYHGNLTEIFGVDLAIRAMAIARDDMPEAEMHIYGQGKVRKQLEKLIKDLSLQDRVFINSPVPRISVPDILRNADLGVDPKRDGVLAGEGLSSKCMEYLSMGLPAVVSSIRAARTYYDDSMVAFFEPGNSEDLARRMVELYRSTEKRKQLKRGSERFSTEHGWIRYEKVFYGIVDDLVNDGAVG
jgi:glycosyltransferase involved in cell wall biosynthesis